MTVHGSRLARPEPDAPGDEGVVRPPGPPQLVAPINAQPINTTTINRNAKRTAHLPKVGGNIQCHTGRHPADKSPNLRCPTWTSTVIRFQRASTRWPNTTTSWIDTGILRRASRFQAEPKHVVSPIGVGFPFCELRFVRSSRPLLVRQVTTTDTKIILGRHQNDQLRPSCTSRPPTLLQPSLKDGSGDHLGTTTAAKRAKPAREGDASNADLAVFSKSRKLRSTGSQAVRGSNPVSST
jgi:hypothetical protein